MANIFITYGDKNYKKSQAVIKKEAKTANIFNRIITYTPKDLPLAIKSSPLFLFKRGGGYWVWKPWVIYETMSKCQDGDIVYYADAGCTLKPSSKEWNIFKENIQSYNAIFFQYRSDVTYGGWHRFITRQENFSPKIMHWMKPSTTQYFREYFNTDDFLQFNKIWAGFIIFRKCPQTLAFLEEWLNITLYHPELICDPFGKELSQIPSTFNVHRHDQAIITPLVYKYKEEYNLLVVPETSESDRTNAAIIASRRAVWTWNILDKIMFRIKSIRRKLRQL